MTTTTASGAQGTAQETAQAHYSIGAVTSKDGTRIHYRRLGYGPGVVLLHGSMESAQSHMGLAQALADGFTVYLPERRDHQLPGPFRKDYSMQQEVDDLDALIGETGTHNVFGVSSGGLIALQAALILPAVRKAAIYEPALIVNGSISTAFLPRYNREITGGNVPAALITAMQGAQLGPAIFNVIPRPLLEFLTTRAMQSEAKTSQPGDVTMRMLAPTLHYDFELVAEMAEKLATFKAVPAEVLLLGGGKSPAWLKAALAALMTVLPHAQRVEFPELDHSGSSDASATNRGGRPAVVAQELHRFFA